MVAIAEASQPAAFDGWIRTNPDHPVQLSYKSGWTRALRLRDLKPADIVEVRSAVMVDTDDSIEHLESAAGPVVTTWQQPPGGDCRTGARLVSPACAWQE